MIPSLVVPIIVLVIIGFQFFFFLQNIKRMRDFKTIFSGEEHWRVVKNIETGFVLGIEGEGNSIFLSIRNSINKYLIHHTGAVIDFQLVKDSIDRHCDAVESDINVQTPLPLYCGLVGTMLGVILGLFPLISSGALIFLLSGNLPENVSEGQMEILAAEGIHELLRGVAWAMSASICGIFLTTVNSVFFKSFKLEEETGKNEFFVWLQSYLLPELPSDTSDALNGLVRNLNSFNRTFASNTEELKTAFDKVNSSYKIQADVIKAVHDMDVMKMAKVNVRVLEELQKSTEKLSQFNTYLNSVQGYTNSIQRFTELFDSESDRLHVLEEIKEFFNRHKAEISRDMADSDLALKDSLKNMKDSTAESMEIFKKEVTTQTETLKDILREEQETFTKLNHDIKNQFADELGKTSTLIKNLEEISKIPTLLDTLMGKIENSNNLLLRGIDKSVSSALSKQEYNVEVRPEKDEHQVLPKWLIVLASVSLFLITVACITNTLYNIMKGENIHLENIFGIL